MADHRKPPLEEDPESLARQINTAIASSHTKINRLILDRMPKAVPPQADNPSIYITGLLHFGAVYIAFESLWQNILGIHSEIAPIPYTYPFTRDPGQHDETPQITERIRHILDVAYWSTMSRAARIKADIQVMTGWPPHVVDEQLRSVGTTGRLGKFLTHIQASVNAKPHVLLAYAYSLYLALLSGGSYIRTELMYLKADFWHATPSPIRPNMVECMKTPDLETPRRRSTSEFAADSHGLARNDASIKMPLEFLDFDPPLGENPRQQARELKVEFKKRFVEAEQALSDPERKDIVKEAVVIFQSMETMVAQLDQICGTSQAKEHVQRTLHPPPLSPRSTNLGFRLRDSIAIAKGRLLRMRRKSSGNSIPATAPAATEETTTDSSPIISSKPSSLSSLSGGYKDSPPEVQSSALARDAVLPGEGFRTIRYDSDLPRPDRSLRDDNEKDQSHPHGFDGTHDDIEYCPISRVPAIAEKVLVRDSPNYALYAIISNIVVFVGVTIVFVAYLYVRHGDRPPRPLEL